MIAGRNEHNNSSYTITIITIFLSSESIRVGELWEKKKILDEIFIIERKKKKIIEKILPKKEQKSEMLKLSCPRLETQLLICQESCESVGRHSDTAITKKIKS